MSQQLATSVPPLAVATPRAGLRDSFGRTIRYVRLSVTDRCDFRCQYCMPMQVKFLPKQSVLSLEECLQIARVFAGLGVDKIRVTGGEPLVRQGVVGLCARIAALPGVREVAMTTNGSQLRRLAKDLQAVGVRRVNISLDTLDATRFRNLTRTGDLAQVLDGIAAANAAGFAGGVKINTVMMRGVNDDELAKLADFALRGGMDISFIEEMPLGDVGHWRGNTYLSADDAIATLRQHWRLTPSDYDSGGPARYWNVGGYSNRIGFITPHSHNFCAACNRVRVNTIGELFPCLGQNDKVDLKPALRGVNGDDAASDDALRARILQAMQIKPKGHDFDIYASGAKVMRFMSATGG